VAAEAEPALDMSKHKSGIVPTLQCVPSRGLNRRPLKRHESSHHHACLLRRNLVATVNLDCKLDLKTITLHARNAEYNPKARERLVPTADFLAHDSVSLLAALRGCHHAHPRPEDDGADFRKRQAGASPGLPRC
jgi:hypothetical protein